MLTTAIQVAGSVGMSPAAACPIKKALIYGISLIGLRVVND